ncbi:MAG: DUF6249 domain-containing protein [Candidatus Cryptobacteroides sp.]|nr:DUF6249 domain-containing protein [Bacteroidales bacterium]
MVYKLIADFIDVLIPISVCAILPIVIVWITSRVRQNETNRKAEIMLKAIEKGVQIDPGMFESKKSKKTIKERLMEKLTGACVTSFMGIGFLLLALIPQWQLPGEQRMNHDELLFLLAAGVLLSVGIALFISYFVGKKLMDKEIATEEKRMEEGR